MLRPEIFTRATDWPAHASAHRYQNQILFEYLNNESEYAVTSVTEVTAVCGRGVAYRPHSWAVFAAHCWLKAFGNGDEHRTLLEVVLVTSVIVTMFSYQIC